MAFFQMNYHSDALRMGVSVNVILPEAAKTAIGIETREAATYKTLYLYHGLSDDQTIWERRTSVERYAAEYGIAVVMPCVARSWYTDTAYGMKYFTFVADELPRVCRGFFRGMSDRREDNLVAGLSMGGYGAVKVALSRPDRFGFCASLSGVLDITESTRYTAPEERCGNFGFAIGSTEELRGGKEDLFFLAKKLHDEKKPLPKTYLWCGEEDPLLSASENYAALLSSLGAEYRYEHSEGNHAWKWWDLHIQDALAYLLK